MPYVPGKRPEGEFAESAGSPGHEKTDVQLRALNYAGQVQLLRPGLDSVQFEGAGGTQNIHSLASAGLSGSSSQLPHAGKIQQAFGGHDVSGVQFHSDARANSALGAMGAQAYASGNKVAGSASMDLHTAAHEAAHVVQQRAGVSLSGGVGKAGDTYENQADAVADAVVGGRSVESMLGPSPRSEGGKGVQAKVLQFIGPRLDQDPDAGGPQPIEEYKDAAGEVEQRQWKPEDYVRMWQEEQGRAMTPAERETIDRGCIGITAANLQGGGNPLSSALKVFDNFDSAQKLMREKNSARNWFSSLPLVGGLFSKKRYVVFAKLFWSNQSSSSSERAKFKTDAGGREVALDDSAYRADPRTHEVDMSGYKYKARPGFVNFDYGFWDDPTETFWHANHGVYEDAPDDPMIVLQSTREKFAHGYDDFDRCVYGVALAENYNPALAAIIHAGG